MDYTQTDEGVDLLELITAPTKFFEAYKRNPNIWFAIAVLIGTHALYEGLYVFLLKKRQ